MKQFDKNVSFASVDLSKVAAQKPSLMRRQLDDVYRLLLDGRISPISTTAYCISNIEQAFCALQGGKVTRKLVVILSADAVVKATPRRNIVRYTAGGCHLSVDRRHRRSWM
ncbi:hypothetical protein EDB81DRAFT_772042 [Dactylonectria macrodidyma]|uniref:Uncharacterized protein n=1 Tax=Dactylonectria macrodidyma TaxID=307937 RepID=A0A9P9JRD7_9HYPO|nr:hypothetical protein EDB81DRAFT_772042 [Dactylonectria macrodidyma]